MFISTGSRLPVDRWTVSLSSRINEQKLKRYTWTCYLTSFFCRSISLSLSSKASYILFLSWPVDMMPGFLSLISKEWNENEWVSYLSVVTVIFLTNDSDEFRSLLTQMLLHTGLLSSSSSRSFFIPWTTWWGRVRGWFQVESWITSPNVLSHQFSARTSMISLGYHLVGYHLSLSLSFVLGRDVFSSSRRIYSGVRDRWRGGKIKAIERTPFSSLFSSNRSSIKIVARIKEKKI